MTTTRPASGPPASPEDWQQQCMQYLLGELDLTQTKSFEQQLDSSAELGEELLRQAEVIAGLSDATSHRSLARVASAHRARPAWPLVASAAAVAACIAVAVLGINRNTSSRARLAKLPGSKQDIGHPNHLEDLLIARAWASHQHDADDDLELIEPDVEEAIEFASEDDALDDESTLSWMFIAVSAGAESFAEGVASDG